MLLIQISNTSLCMQSAGIFLCKEHCSAPPGFLHMQKRPLTEPLIFLYKYFFYIG